jgi:hexosaminidase
MTVKSFCLFFNKTVTKFKNGTLNFKNVMIKIIGSLFLQLTMFQVIAQNNLNLVPMPAEVKTGNGNFILSSSTAIITEGSIDKKAVAFFKQYMIDHFGIEFKINKTKPSPATQLLFSFLNDYAAEKGKYALSINKNSIELKSGTEEGFFYGIQTLLQLLPSGKKIQPNNNAQFNIPQLSIKDYPRFSYRGMHLDVGRHFYSLDFIKKYIDYLAAYKYNTFHWHLTEDQGWRIEIKKYPKLTQIGGFRNGTIMGRYPGKGNDNTRYGGFYTQDQIKEIVQYAANRCIDVIPEIELPGHSSAAIAAYPELSCFPDEDTKILNSTPWSGSRTGKQVQQTWGVFEDVFCPSEFTFNFLENVLDEVMTLFPSKYIHIGGDESPKEAWKRSPFCQQLIKDKNLKDEHGLQSYFIQRIEKYINSKGKKIIGWDEILEGGLAPNATVMSWRGEQGGIMAAKQKHDVIMTPGTHCYLDHSQSKTEDSVTIGGYLPLEKVYSYEPVPAALNAAQAKYVLGAQGNVWTEYMKNSSNVEYMIFPRMIALSEVLWSPKTKRNWKDFERRLPVILDRLGKQKINFSKAYYDLNATVLPTENNVGLLWKLESVSKNTISLHFNNEDSTFTYSKPLLINPTVSLVNASSNGLKLSQKFHFNKATGKKIILATEPSKNYPGDGAFTLVNGVQNEKGLARGSEFLGFLGTDLEATIDLGKETAVSKITLHTLSQNGSWIYLPGSFEVSFIPFIDTTIITKHAPIELVSQQVMDENDIQVMQLPEPKICRYIKVYAKNYGIIPSGKPGSGNPAWLFVDEIEVE